MRDIDTGPPNGARGMCPNGGLEYADAVQLFARSMALLAKAAGLKAAGDHDDAIAQYVFGGSGFVDLLQVWT